MAITKTVGTPTDISAATTHVISHDAGSNPKFAIVITLSNSFDSQVTAVSYGGVALAKLKVGTWTVGSQATCQVWGVISGSLPSGVNDFSITSLGFNTIWAVPYTGTANGPVQLGNTYSGNGSSGSFCATAVSTLPAMTFAGNAKAYSSVCGSPGAALDYNTAAVGAAVSEVATATGSRSVGVNANSIHGGAAVMVEELEIEYTPPTIDIEIDAPAPVFTIAADRTYFPPTVDILIDAPDPLFDIDFPRQVALLGNAETIWRAPYPDPADANPVLLESVCQRAVTDLVPIASIAGGALAVAEVDGTPDVADVTRIELDQADGFTVTDGGGGQVTIGVTHPGGGGGYFDNLIATTDPTVGDDDVDGYEPGSLWLNQSAGTVWRCLDASTGAAVWLKMTTGGDAGWTLATFTNSWVAYFAGSGLSYRKLASGLVVFRGEMKGGTAGTSICTLPSGYRSAIRVAIPIRATGATNFITTLNINTDGTVVPATDAGNAYLSTVGSFFADGS